MVVANWGVLSCGAVMCFGVSVVVRVIRLFGGVAHYFLLAGGEMIVCIVFWGA